jgi:hypothetical protein
MSIVRRIGRTAAATASKEVVFVENAIPPLRDGKYLLSATQTIPDQKPGTFTAAATFVVSGERFAIQPAEVNSLFPPNLANGEFDGVLPHVVLNRRTLPWERQITTPGSAKSYPDAPWLAVLVCDDETAPPRRDARVKDLVPEGTHITVRGSSVTDEGTLVPTTLSYGAALLHELDDGENPDDPCTVIDLPVATFNQIAPAAADLTYLAHVREVDTVEGADSVTTHEEHAVVIANRMPAVGAVTRAFLVSLEGMADYLPGPEGMPSPAIGSQIDTVRLIAFQSWTFTVNDLDETLEKLLEGLNDTPEGGTPITTLVLPITGPTPSAAAVAQAMAHQADGSVSADDATVLMRNALLMGYVPSDHHLRHGGHTVSFYRGPFVPLAVPPTGATLYSGPDAANAYNPQTGMFDVSYGAAWQLGQLLMVQSTGVANQLYRWKHEVTLRQAIAAENAILAQRLGGAEVFPTVFARRGAAAERPPLPEDVVNWFGDLAALRGVPFNYLVPDERMLPPESIRFFQVDQNWLDALIDGAFSIGRAGTSAESLEARHAPMVRRLARSRAGRRRANRRTAAAGRSSAPASGFLLRSQAVAGWPNLRVIGSDSVEPVRIGRLSEDTMLCLFDAVVRSMSLREPPEQLHHGVQKADDGYYTTLRSVVGGPGQVEPGEQYTTNPRIFKTPCDPAGTNPWTCVPVRPDGRTILVSDTAVAIHSRLSTDFEQPFPDGFTAADFALEMTKGVVEVEFRS